MSSERCPTRGTNCSCPATDQEICDKYYSYSVQKSWPAGLAMDSKNDLLVTCHNLHHGECRLVDLDNFEFLKQRAEYIAMDTTDVKRESQPTLLVDNGPNGQVVYQANNVLYEAVQRLYGASAPPPTGQLFLLTTRQIPSLEPLTFEEPVKSDSNILDLKTYKDLKLDSLLAPLHIFAHQGCTYFLGADSDVSLVRMCQSFPTKHSLVSAIVNLR